MDITLYNLNETDFALTESRLNALGFLNIIQKGLNNKTIKPFIEIKNIPMIHDYNDIINKFKKANITPLSKSIEKNFNNNNTYNISFIFNLNNNLLIIGNGFDLEHDLKTHYTDFFDTINNNVSSKNEIILNNNKYLIKDNNLLLYLIKEYKQNKLQGNNWIDIETELKKIISLIEEININNFIDNMSYYSGDEYTTIKKIQSKSSYYFKNCLFPFIIGNNYYKYINEHYNISIKILEKDLNELTNMLRDYLLEQDISNLTKTKDISDIDYKITHVLSFNYTDTFRKIYSDIDDDKIDFIHGSLNKNNLVLGINETLTEDTANKIVDTVYFKKYFQRIYKKTDYKYVSWLDPTDYKNYADFDTVYIHGHSLDESDKEILEKIINSVLKKYTPTVKIFYYDEKHYRQEVTNLIKILGKDVFQKYYFQNRIIFIKQTPKR
ncbi:AbiH family protein [Megamonas funiformis]|uniref:AbiH family protein n=2 Tax=Megamonas funiformis TaxID=437897 RepID=UPI0022DF8E0D|nr:AbiH family protein [Megamonas funiformis]